MKFMYWTNVPIFACCEIYETSKTQIVNFFSALNWGGYITIVWKISPWDAEVTQGGMLPKVFV